MHFLNDSSARRPPSPTIPTLNPDYTISFFRGPHRKYCRFDGIWSWSQLVYYMGKVATDNKEMNQLVCVPIKFYYPDRQQAGFGFQPVTCQLLPQSVTSARTLSLKHQPLPWIHRTATVYSTCIILVPHCTTKVVIN